MEAFTVDIRGVVVSQRATTGTRILCQHGTRCSATATSRCPPNAEITRQLFYEIFFNSKPTSTSVVRKTASNLIFRSRTPHSAKRHGMLSSVDVRKTVLGRQLIIRCDNFIRQTEIKRKVWQAGGQTNRRTSTASWLSPSSSLSSWTIWGIKWLELSRDRVSCRSMSPATEVSNRILIILCQKLKKKKWIWKRSRARSLRQSLVSWK